MKKILSIFLCLAMLLSLGTLAASAADVTADYVLYASYGNVTIDGVKDDSMHLTLNPNNNSGGIDFNVEVGAVWNANNLYIGVYSFAVNSNQRHGRPIDQVSTSVICENGYKTTVQRGVATAGNAAGGTNTTAYTYKNAYANSETSTPTYLFTEFEIPMDQLNFYQLDDRSLAAKVTLSVSDWGWKDETDADLMVVLTDYSILAARDAAGATANASAINGEIDNKINYTNKQAGAAHGGSWDRGYYQVYLNTYADNACTLKPIRTDAGVLKAGVAALLNVDLAFSQFGSTAGPVEAENWTYCNSSATSNWRVQTDADTSNGSNPTRIVLTAKLNENGANGAALLAYAIYNVGGEIRLYSAEATSANAPYVVLDGAVVGFTSNKANNIDLRLEVGTDYKTVVTMNGKYMGTLAAPSVTAYDAVAVKDWTPSELTVVAIADASNYMNVVVKNGGVSEKNADATEILTDLANSIVGVYGHQDTITAVNGKYSVRFLAELPVDLANYSALGYDIEIKNNNGTAKTTVELTRVYESVSNDTTGHDGLKAVVALRGIETADGDCTITVKPWAVVANGGQTLYGDAYSVTYTAAADGTLSFE